MRVIEVPPHMGTIAKREAFSQIRAAIHRAIEVQITERRKSDLKKECASRGETWWQHLRENHQKYGRIL